MSMTHKDLIELIKTSRPLVTDEFALQTIDMFPRWEDNIGKTITNDDISKGYDRYQHNGKLYKVVQPTVFQTQYEPGVEGTSSIFVEVSLEEWPEWVQPTGAHDAYAKDAKVTHNSKKWTSDVDANVWEPGVYGWTEFVE